MSDDVLIKVDGVSKKFCRSLKKSLCYGMQDLGYEVLGRRHSGNEELRPDEFWAVKDVSFELKRGECLGLIGPNGAGKTTLLRMLNGLIKPDQGRIEMRGRVGALIALGAGFNPILTGRENIYVNASVLGLSKREIDEKFDEIVDFAEIGEFIDSPVQSYSSGMQVRLGFAVATALEPDILLLDEVLAVGDAAFRNKCYRRIAMLRKSTAMIFVTHSIEQVARICDCVMVLSRGKSQGMVTVEDGVSSYNIFNKQEECHSESFLSFEPPIKNFEYILPINSIKTGSDFSLIMDFHSNELIDNFVLRVTVYNENGGVAADCNFESKIHVKIINFGLNSWKLYFPSVQLKNGKYKLSIALIDNFGGMKIWSHKQQQLEIIGGYVGAIADCQLQFILAANNVILDHKGNL